MHYFHIYAHIHSHILFQYKFVVALKKYVGMYVGQKGIYKSYLLMFTKIRSEFNVQQKSYNISGQLFQLWLESDGVGVHY